MCHCDVKYVLFATNVDVYIVLSFVLGVDLFDFGSICKNAVA